MHTPGPETVPTHVKAGQEQEVCILCHKPDKPACSSFGSDGKASAYNEGDLGSIPGREDVLEKAMATHYSILAWKIPWTEEPVRLQSMRSQRVRQDWATSLSLTNTLTFFTSVPLDTFLCFPPSCVTNWTTVCLILKSLFWNTNFWSLGYILAICLTSFQM